jgi:tyrosinase
MRERFTSEPLELPEADADFSRADLVFYGVDHSGASYEGRVYLDHDDADAATGYDHDAYAGSFHIFGHGGCFGEEGHCLVPTEPPDPFDLRGPHQLTPVTKAVIATAAIRRLLTRGAQSTRVTVVAVAAGERGNDVLEFTRLRLVTYE